MKQEEGLHFLDYWRVIRSRKEIILSVLLIVVLTGIGVTYSMPHVFESKTRIKIERERGAGVFRSELPDIYDPVFLPTQYEIIQSSKVLSEVIMNLNLINRFKMAYGMTGDTEDDMQEAIAILRKQLKVQQYRDTKLIEISVRLSRPSDEARQLTADIANEVASVFKQQRRGVTLRETRMKIDGLEEAYERQKSLVSKLDTELQALKQELGIVIDDYQNFQRVDPLDQEILRALATQHIQARLELRLKEYQKDALADKTGDALLNVAAFVIRDPNLAQLRIQRSTEGVMLEQLRETLGANHPQFLQQKAAIDELNINITDALTGLKMGLDADFKAAKLTFDDLEKRVEEKRAEQITQRAEKEQVYRKKKEEYDSERLIRDQLQARLTQERIELDIPRENVEVIDAAVVPPEYSYVSPNMTLNIILSVIVGLGTGIALAYFIEYLDTSVKTVDDIEELIGAKVVGIIPQKVKPLIEAGPSSPHAEAYRVLRTNLKFNGADQDGGYSMTITSGGVGEGKSLTLFNLAYVCSTLGDRVLVIDSDMRRPRQHSILGVPNDIGLADVLFSEVSVSDAIIETEAENLFFMPSGKLPSEYYGVLDPERVQILCRALKQQFDFIFFDAPPIMGVSDASVLAGEVDGVLLVIQHRKHPRGVAQRAKGLIDHAGGKLLGVVLNNINVSKDYSYYYQAYYSSYSSYSGKQLKQKTKAQSQKRKNKRSDNAS